MNRKEIFKVKQETELQKMKKAELIEYIKEIEEELQKAKEHNNRGAGRKEKFSNEQIEQIIEVRNAGNSIRTIAEQFQCSVGLVHKLINERKEDI